MCARRLALPGRDLIGLLRGSEATLSFLMDFIYNFHWQELLDLLIHVLAALFCIIFHECAHGYAADRLGDHTARERGRLSWNPIRHIDPMGLLLMVVAGVGWAKPVPVDPRHFKHPKQGMALTALAGPASNLVLTVVALLIGRFLYPLSSQLLYGTPVAYVYIYCFSFIAYVAVLSLGLGLFNLIPISPLDGSKVLLSLLPDRIYFNILRYERYVMLLLIVLVFFGVFDSPLQYCINGVLSWLCQLTGFPASIYGL
jgi:Zn-dependent protease